MRDPHQVLREKIQEHKQLIERQTRLLKEIDALRIALPLLESENEVHHES